ncbi:MAG: SDR family NAD(P)-dependent oxidoreductase [Candidatus Norongarragalinales archaeon]
MSRLSGKVAVVTGGSKGIGEGIARVFAKEGAKVCIADVDFSNAKKVASSIGANALAVACDVSKMADAKEAVAATVKKFGKLDVLVNNAGIYPFKNFLDYSDGEDDWEKTMAVNLDGVKNCTLVAARQMKKQGRGGRIITISSIAGLKGYRGLVHYCATKAGVLGFTRALALELAPLKINVNAVCPGLIDTPGVRALGMTNEVVNATAKAIPVQRPGKPDDIAWACVYLASEESSFVTGQAIVVDGGDVVK